MISALLLLASLALAAPSNLEKRATLQAGCSNYILIASRGTGTAQGTSAGFDTMNANIRRNVAGGSQYNVVYPATADQNTAPGTTDLINKVNSALAADNKTCFILQGYSQGAQVTIDALPSLTSALQFNAVKGVLLLGNGRRRAGLACNVDNNDGTTTKNSNGCINNQNKPVPSNWVSKTLDICIKGDGVCDMPFLSICNINNVHTSYPSDSPTQSLGARFVTAKLAGTAFS